MTTMPPTAPDLVFVWLGDALPDWAKIALRIAGRTSGLSTVLICSRKIGVVDGVARQVWLEDVYEPPEDKWAAKKGSSLASGTAFGGRHSSDSSSWSSM